MVRLFFALLFLLPAVLLHANEPVLVAVIDSVMNEALPALSKNLVAGHDYVSHRYAAPDYDDHATAIAGIIIKVAPDVNIMPIAVAHHGVSSPRRVINAIVSAIEHGAHVINLSITITDEVLLGVRDRVGLEKFNDAVLVVAAGNQPIRFADLKKHWPNVITVAALSLTQDRALASYSSFGPRVDIAAPAGDSGDGLFTIDFFGRPRRFNGTSAAAPIISALAATIKAVQPNADGVALKQAIWQASKTSEHINTRNGEYIDKDMLPSSLFAN